MARIPSNEHAVLLGLALAAIAACGGPQTTELPSTTETDVVTPTAPTDVAAEGPTALRVATFNTSLYGSAPGDIATQIAAGSAHAECIATVIAAAQPDVLLVNELDYDAEGAAAAGLAALVEAAGWELPYVYVAPSNTGVPSGFDLDHSGEVAATVGEVAYGNDAMGFGRFEGQYAFAVFSRYPIDLDGVRTFQHFLWRDMPGASLPDDLATDAPDDWYTSEALEVLRLSSKNHADVPILVGDEVVHVLASHPTPPAFDGEEDRNGHRNHDEIRLWVDYIGEGDGSYLVDDAGRSGGLETGAHFVIVGDLNADPIDGTGRQESIQAMLGSPLTIDPQPVSEGAVEDAARDGGLNTTHQADPAVDTGDFDDDYVGNLRIDYAVPSATVEVVGSGVFWPVEGDPLAACAAVSDHHLVWVDIVLP